MHYNKDLKFLFDDIIVIKKNNLIVVKHVPTVYVKLIAHVIWNMIFNVQNIYKPIAFYVVDSKGLFFDRKGLTENGLILSQKIKKLCISMSTEKENSELFNAKLIEQPNFYKLCEKIVQEEKFVLANCKIDKPGQYNLKFSDLKFNYEHIKIYNPDDIFANFIHLGDNHFEIFILCLKSVGYFSRDNIWELFLKEEYFKPFIPLNVSFSTIKWVQYNIVYNTLYWKNFSFSNIEFMIKEEHLDQKNSCHIFIKTIELLADFFNHLKRTSEDILSTKKHNTDHEIKKS